MPRVTFTSSDETDTDVDIADNYRENSFHVTSLKIWQYCCFSICRLDYKCSGGRHICFCSLFVQDNINSSEDHPIIDYLESTTDVFLVRYNLYTVCPQILYNILI